MIENISNVLNGIIWIAIIALNIGIIIRVVKERTAKEVEVKAVVINKQSYIPNTVRRYPVGPPQRKYSITFLCDNKRLHFDVSAYSYDNYRINQQGILKYKGSKLIDFRD